jgi:hypothetical protein
MGSQFYDSPFWRFVVTDLDSVTLTFLDKLASDRTVTYRLGKPALATGRLPSDNPEVNILHTDGYPFVAEGVRLMYGFRKELESSSVFDEYVIRFAGMLLQIEDAAEEDDATSRYTAFDPWQYLYARPVQTIGGVLPGPEGLNFGSATGDVLVGTLLRNTIVTDGPARIDAGVTYGGTGFYTGTIETTSVLDDVVFQQGLSVGKAWEELVATGTLDIVLTPIYDPINRPGYLAELNVYEQAGEQRDEAIFAWDEPSRSLSSISHLLDGTNRATTVRYYAGMGGPAVAPVTDAAAEALFGSYVAQQFWPGQVDPVAVEAFAELALELRARGREVVTIGPVPEASPLPFTEYFLGDRVPVYASSNLRQAIPQTVGTTEQYMRVYGIPLTIADDATERVTRMLTSPED